MVYMTPNPVQKSFGESSGTCDILQLLLDKLCGRGLLLGQIPRFLKDVVNITDGYTSMTAVDLNQRLQRLGWGEQVMDAYTLELVKYLLENQAEALAQAG
jgi:hypothetical protein